MHPDDIRFWLLLWLIVSASSICGLLAIWAALSPRHWFGRAAVLMSIAWVLALVRAYDLIIGFAAETACIVYPLLFWRLWTARAKQGGVSATRGRMRFRLTDLLFTTTVCAAVAAIVSRFPAEVLITLPVYLVWGAACGCTVTAACCALLGGRALILTAITPLVAAFWPSRLQDLFDGLMLSNPPCLYDWGWPGLAWYPALALVAAILVFWLLLFRATSRQSRRGRLIFPQAAFFALSFAIALPSLLAFWQIVTPTPKPVVLLPTPNGYDELKRIGMALEASVPQDVDAATEADLRKFVEEHRHDLDDVLAALTHESLVPLSYAPDDIADMGPIRNIYRGLWANARLAEFDGRCDSTSATNRPASLARNDATTLNTASLKPPIFKMSPRSGT